MQCPSCRNSDVARLGAIPPDFRFAGRDLRRLVGGGDLMACQSCALHFRWPQPDSEELNNLYRLGDIDNWQYDEGSRIDWKFAQDWLTRHHHDGNVLDVGCFDGAFLRTLTSTLNRFGVDPHTEAASRATGAGIEILGATLDDLDAKFENFFDAIVAFDVIEHIPDPLAFVARCVALVREGGSVVIGTGDADAPSRRMMGARYWYCAIPEHLSFLNERWMAGCAESLGLAIALTRAYSHIPGAPWTRRLSEVGTNAVCRFAPSVWRQLRRMGFGGIDVSLDARLRDYPPQWMTAKDHMLVVLQK